MNSYEQVIERLMHAARKRNAARRTHQIASAYALMLDMEEGMFLALPGMDFTTGEYAEPTVHDDVTSAVNAAEAWHSGGCAYRMGPFATLGDPITVGFEGEGG